MVKEVSTILRRLQCHKCQVKWNWLDPNTPSHCPFCGHTFATVWPVEVGKTVVKVAPDWPQTKT